MCEHPATTFFRHPFGDGSAAHVAEHCPACGANVRGPGRWVPQTELAAKGIERALLPVWRGPNDETEPMLFGADG